MRAINRKPEAGRHMRRGKPFAAGERKRKIDDDVKANRSPPHLAARVAPSAAPRHASARNKPDVLSWRRLEMARRLDRAQLRKITRGRERISVTSKRRQEMHRNAASSHARSQQPLSSRIMRGRCIASMSSKRNV